MKKLTIIIIIALNVQLYAQDIVGDWYGKINFQGMELKLILHVTEFIGSYQSTLDSPDQGATGIAIDTTTFEDGVLRIESNALQLEYTAELVREGTTLEGTFIQSGITIPLVMTKRVEETGSINPIEASSVDKVLGDWYGLLEIPGIELRIVFHVAYIDGELESTLDSPDQNAFGIPMNNTMYTEGRLSIVAPALNAEYEAELDEEEDILNGTFTQNGISYDLIMKREIIERDEVIRPQEPTDFPYVREKVKFENPEGGHRLAGTLTIPEDGKFEKVVVLISGSGPQDRNEEVQVINHKPFLVLSDYLTRQGIAVLRYDDRGVAESEGTFTGATTEDFADDATAAVDYLKSRKDMQGKKIGLVGHSEGGMIAPMVASQNEDVDFIVLMAGPGIEIQKLLLLQQEKTGEAEGIPTNIRQYMDKLVKNLFEYIDKNINLKKDELREGVRDLSGQSYDQLPDEVRREIGTKDNFINQQSNMLTSDWYLFILRFSPDHFLSRVKCPVLAVNGELDLQVVSKENLEGIRESLKRANNNNATIHEFEGLNHLFQKTETGAPSEYRTLEETFNEDAMAFISNWIIALEI